LRQRRDKDDQRRDGQILEQQHAENQATMLAIEFVAFRQQFADDGGGRHGDDAAQRQAGFPRQAKKETADHDDEHADRDLQAAESEYGHAHGFQAGKRKLEADREHQEDNAELGQMRGRRIRTHAMQKRPQANTDQDVTEQSRHAGGFQQRQGENTGGEQDKCEFERGVHFVC